MRLIDADEINKYLKKNKMKRITLIDTAQTVDAVPVVHAHIIMKDGHKACSVCGTRLSAVKQHYCPNCGAKMDEVEDGTD